MSTNGIQLTSVVRQQRNQLSRKNGGMHETIHKNVLQTKEEVREAGVVHPSLIPSSFVKQTS